MSWLPITLHLQGRPCLVVGGGAVAVRKVRQLRKAGADVHVVATELAPELAALRESGGLRWSRAMFAPEHLDGCALAIAATDDRAVNARVSELAQQRGIPVNVVDDPALCSFIMPSVVDRSPVTIAISTGAASPVLARLLRARLETLIPAGFGRLAGLMKDFRERVRRRFPDVTARRRFWEHVLQGPVAEMLYAGQETRALAALEKRLQDDTATVEHGGEVYLVGAGPGDPDLLTFRALRLMQQADVILYDRLVAPALVDLCRKDAERIFVGKESDQHTVPQGELNQLMVRLARGGKRVLRLKGGDPFIFGRGGEEIEDLAACGIPFQVVPGITAAAGCASYAGIPLTHRDYAHSVVFVTGHMKDDKLSLNWDVLVQPRQTIAVYMGVKGMEALSGGLLAHGMRPDMPAAIIEHGTTPRQRVHVSTVAGLPAVVRERDIQPPSMTIIGEVVRLQEKLAWFEPST